MEFIGNLKNTVVNAFSNTTPSPPSITKAEVLGLEEGERERRMAQVTQSNVDKQNAANISGIIKTQNFPVFRGNVSKGYKRVTTRFEEEERRRRLTNKSESALRRANGNKTSRMVQELGWPFYQQHRTGGAEYIVMDPSRLLEEEEREWRTSDSYWGPTAKHNAAMVANILRWGSFQRNPRAGHGQHLKFLQEKERKDRVSNHTDSDVERAYNEAGLIRHMGAPFYVQDTSLARRNFSELNKLEELERKRRIANPEGQQLAREVAGLIAEPNHSINDVELEEQERGRRMMDKQQENIAKKNAKHVSLMVRESSSNQIKGAGPMWFSISRNSMRALEEIERTRRLRDIEGQRSAKQHAKLVSAMVSGQLSAPRKASIHTIEEGERQSRMVDRPQQQLAMKNARKVSGFMARHNLMSSGSKDFALALEESERTRRIQDDNQQSLARDNARKVSNLVSSLSVAPSQQMVQEATRSPTLSAPIAPVAAPVSTPTYDAFIAPTNDAPIYDAPVSTHVPLAAPVSVAPVATPIAPVAAPTAALPSWYTPPVTPSPVAIDMPRSANLPTFSAIPTTSSEEPFRSSSEFRPVNSPLVSAPTPTYSAPISSPLVAAAPAPTYSAPAPTYSAPISAAPVSAAPVSAAPISAAPISAAPISAAPISTAPISAAPISAAPISAPVRSAPVSVAPISAAPVASGANYGPITPMALPTTSSAVPVAPLASAAPVRQSSLPVVPVDISTIGHPSLGERERKKLLKQADRHNRKSEKDVRKAEQSMIKAEKLHQKGRDDKAAKLESKAEMFMKNAEHERKWASGLHGEVSNNAPAPASM